MSCTYKISTQDKKSIVQVEIFHKTDGNETYEARIEQTWRWGHVVLSGVEKDEIDLENPEGLMVTDYSIEDQDLSDGVALWFYYSDNTPEEVRELFESAWEEDWYNGIEDIGWSQWDTEMMFHGPLEAELLEEVEDEEEDGVGKPTSAWPF